MLPARKNHATDCHRDPCRCGADEINRLRRRLAAVRERIGHEVRRSLVARIHGGCLASLTDERVQQLIADVTGDVSRAMTGEV